MAQAVYIIEGKTPKNEVFPTPSAAQIAMQEQMEKENLINSLGRVYENVKSVRYKGEFEEVPV